VRFLVVEDDELVGRAICRLLAPYGESMVALTVLEAQRILGSRADWSAFFIDLRLPDGSGIDVLAEARVDHPTTPAMLLTGCVEANAINAAFDLDADYVVKPVRRQRIVRFLLARPDFASKLRQTVSAWRDRYALSGAELDVLQRAAAGETRDAIAEARGCALPTVKTHVANLLEKTGDDSLLGAVARLLRTLGGDSVCD
jgi:two-component system response regulator DevR